MGHGYGNRTVFYAIHLAGNVADSWHHRLVLHLYVCLRDRWRCGIFHRGENAGIHIVDIGRLGVIALATVDRVEGVHTLENCAVVEGGKAVEEGSSAEAEQHILAKAGIHEVGDSLGEADGLAGDTVDDKLEQEAGMAEVETEKGLKVAHIVV